MVGARKFKFLNQTGELVDANSWNDSSISKLWLYNLHYFDDLNAVHSDSRQAWHRELISTWIDENPIGKGNGWEPYPISLRVVNWIKWVLSGKELSRECKESLLLQVDYLSKRLEKHLLGNHLFTNAKALIFAGLFFEGEEADSWLKKGQEILKRELPEQVLADGGNFELSTMYHAIFLEDCLDIVNIYNCYNLDVPLKIKKIIPDMLKWLSSMTHPDGGISFFNDASHGVASSKKELVDYASRLGFSFDDSRRSVTYLKESGYMRIEQGDVTMILDIAKIGPDYLPGHAHADTLSFECSLFGKRLFVNSGTSEYGTGTQRERQRGTKAHNTLSIDNVDSSEMWAGFRVARRARVENFTLTNNNDEIIVSACHTGYKRLHGQPVHCREWRVARKNISIIDKVTGVGKHIIGLHYHLSPDAVVERIGENEVKISLNDKSMQMRIEGSGELKIETSTYHPEFGLTLENKKIAWLYEGTLPSEFKMSLSW